MTEDVLVFVVVRFMSNRYIGAAPVVTFFLGCYGACIFDSGLMKTAGFRL